jgi:hypothetical protein
MPMKTDEQVSNNSDIYILRDGDVPRKDQVAVLSPYFKDLQCEDDVSVYFASSVLGSPMVRLLYWQGKPAAHCSLFPFPLWVDGKKVIGGKPEGAVIHRDVINRLPRPDVFGMVVDDLLAHARDAGWPLLVGMPSPPGRKAVSRKGFHSVIMPVMETIWPLRVEAFVPRAIGYVARRYPKLSKAIPNQILIGTIRCALKTLSTITRMKTAWGPSVYELIELPMEDLGRYASLVENNYWPDRRVTVWREPNFLQTRLRTKAVYKLLGVWSCVEHKIVALAVVGSDQGALSLLDVLPPTLSLEREFWLELIRFAIRVAANSLRTRLYLNDSVQEAVARQLHLRMARLSVRTNAIFSVYALDPKLTFAYDANAWAGTDMFMAGF